MAWKIQRAFAGAACSLLACLVVSPALAQTQRQLTWCFKGTAFSPALRIDGCTATIQSGRYSGKSLSGAFYNRGIAHANKGENDLAIADFNKTLELDPTSIFALNNRGAAYARKGQYDRAIEDFDDAIRINADYAITFNNRGTAYAKKREYDRAVADFERAVRLDPKDTGALKNLKLAKQLLGNTPRAETNPARSSQNAAPEALKSDPPQVESKSASLSETQSSANHMPRDAPRAETDLAIAPRSVGPETQATSRSPQTEAKVPGGPETRKPAKRLQGHQTRETKVTLASKTHTPSRVKNRYYTRRAVARSKRLSPQSALARFFRQQQINIRNVFRMASQRKSF